MSLSWRILVAATVAIAARVSCRVPDVLQLKRESCYELVSL
ncbi:hypothetical protein HRbin36_02693 [bacterium HR36]|nr:hypothetical protein HRbin36_02693 [bacterium HR36]